MNCDIVTLAQCLVRASSLVRYGAVSNLCFLVTWLSLGAKHLPCRGHFSGLSVVGMFSPIAVQRHLDGWSWVMTGDRKTSP